MSAPEGLHWMKLPIVGMPGATCGRTIRDGETYPTDFPNAGCMSDARWMAGGLLLCDDHAEWLAAQCGDTLEDIAAAISGAM